MAAAPAILLSRHLLRVRDLIDRACAAPLDVLALARSAHVSEAYFSRSFVQGRFGETPTSTCCAGGAVEGNGWSGDRGDGDRADVRGPDAALDQRLRGRLHTDVGRCPVTAEEATLADAGVAADPGIKQWLRP